MGLRKHRSLYSGLPAHAKPTSETLLAGWLREQGLSQMKFAKQAKVSPKIVEHWCLGRCVPSLVLGFHLERVTKGAVPASYWLGTPAGRRAYKRYEDAELLNG